MKLLVGLLAIVVLVVILLLLARPGAEHPAAAQGVVAA